MITKCFFTLAYKTIKSVNTVVPECRYREPSNFAMPAITHPPTPALGNDVNKFLAGSDIKSNTRTTISYLTFTLLIISGVLVFATAFADTSTKQKKTAYSKKGADTCLRCHDEDNEYPVLPIFKTRHGERNDPRSPMAILQCGSVGKHKKKARKGKKKAPIRAFGANAWTPVAEQNKVCLGCHTDHNRMNWQGSVHESESIACASCHVIHARQEPMRDARLQNQKCMSCHLKQRAEFNRSSAHPIRFAKMRCSQCHNPHGTFSENLIQGSYTNKLCYTCHAEKRGPLLWSHAPVDEDCTLCHTAHGSLHPALLKKRPPLLCQSCHSPAGHPSTAYDASGLPSGTANQFLLGKSCLNCHTQVHGSNHPSGVKLLR